MRTALARLLEDFVSAIAFVGCFVLSGDFGLATGVAIAVALGQLVLAALRQRTISIMQLLGLGLAVGLGALTLITRDSRFIRWKPSIAHVAVGAVMLKRGWQLPYLPANVRAVLPEPRLVRWGYVWAVALLLMAAANALAAHYLSVAAWGAFVTGLLAAKFALFGLQYLSLRAAVRRARELG